MFAITLCLAQYCIISSLRLSSAGSIPPATRCTIQNKKCVLFFVKRRLLECYDPTTWQFGLVSLCNSDHVGTNRFAHCRVSDLQKLECRWQREGGILKPRQPAASKPTHARRDSGLPPLVLVLARRNERSSTFKGPVGAIIPTATTVFAARDKTVSVGGIMDSNDSQSHHPNPPLRRFVEQTL